MRVRRQFSEMQTPSRTVILFAVSRTNKISEYKTELHFPPGFPKEAKGIQLLKDDLGRFEKYSFLSPPTTYLGVVGGALLLGVYKLKKCFFSALENFSMA